jgi:hypothetical protein
VVTSEPLDGVVEHLLVQAQGIREPPGHPVHVRELVRQAQGQLVPGFHLPPSRQDRLQRWGQLPDPDGITAADGEAGLPDYPFANIRLVALVRRAAG